VLVVVRSDKGGVAPVLWTVMEWRETGGQSKP
jgi:hypothetical protein